MFELAKLLMLVAALEPALIAVMLPVASEVSKLREERDEDVDDPADEIEDAREASVEVIDWTERKPVIEAAVVVSCARVVLRRRVDVVRIVVSCILAVVLCLR